VDEASSRNFAEASAISGWGEDSVAWMKRWFAPTWRGSFFNTA
jgi:hypothetical protein